MRSNDIKLDLRVWSAVCGPTKASNDVAVALTDGLHSQVSGGFQASGLSLRKMELGAAMVSPRGFFGVEGGVFFGIGGRGPSLRLMSSFDGESERVRLGIEASHFLVWMVFPSSLGDGGVAGSTTRWDESAVMVTSETTWSQSNSGERGADTTSVVLVINEEGPRLCMTFDAGSCWACDPPKTEAGVMGADA